MVCKCYETMSIMVNIAFTAQIRKFAKYTMSDPPLFVAVKTEFKAVGSVTSMILPENAIKSVGEGGALCCTEQLRAKGLCGDTDVIVKRAYEGPREITTLHYNGTDSDELKSTLLYNVTSSGPVYVIIVHCSDKSDTVKIEGYIQWFNPYGELPGNVYPVLPFTGTMALLYLLCLLPYLYLMRKYRGTLLKLQYAIGLVILLGIIEMGSMWIYYMVLNRDGHHVSGALVLALLFSNIKKAFSRVLVLLVAMGFGLVKYVHSRNYFLIRALTAALQVDSWHHQVPSRVARCVVLCILTLIRRQRVQTKQRIHSLPRRQHFVR
jgi:hypothetical protein